MRPQRERKGVSDLNPARAQATASSENSINDLVDRLGNIIKSSSVALLLDGPES